LVISVMELRRSPVLGLEPNPSIFICSACASPTIHRVFELPMSRTTMGDPDMMSSNSAKQVIQWT
jgi:hypothetical protein